MALFLEENLLKRNRPQQRQGREPENVYNDLFESRSDDKFSITTLLLACVFSILLFTFARESRCVELKTLADTYTLCR